VWCLPGGDQHLLGRDGRPERQVDVPDGEAVGELEPECKVDLGQLHDNGVAVAVGDEERV
jgi:hypothetical protein